MSAESSEFRLFLDPARRRSLGSQTLRSPLWRAFRRTVWPLFPRPARRWALGLLLAANRRPLAVGAQAREPISVIGLLSTTTGIGEGGRLGGEALAELGYDVRSVDVSEILENKGGEATPPPLLEKGPGTAILHFNPDNLPAILTLLGRRRLRGKRIIGYWAWELARIPDHWAAALQDVDEIWTPSRFVADAVAKATSKPVRVVPHPVALRPPARRRREHFGIGHRFAVLTMFSIASSFERKNPIAAIRAFRAAFGDSESHLLILKISAADESPDQMAELAQEIGEADNIRIERRLMSDSERLELIASADVLLSLHRSEGFGLIMAEAMLAGVPVVATRWSGNLDFMDEASACLIPVRMVEARDSKQVYGTGEEWADPDVDQAAAQLAALATDPSRRRELGEAGRRRAAERLGLGAHLAIVSPSLGPPRGGHAARRYGRAA